MDNKAATDENIRRVVFESPIHGRALVDEVLAWRKEAAARTVERNKSIREEYGFGAKWRPGVK